MVKFWGTLLLMVCCLAPMQQAVAAGGHGGKTPVLLTIDVEAEVDIKALNQLELKVPATYFMLGWLMEKFPHFAREVAAEGNLIGSHGYTHADLTTLSPEQRDQELSWAVNAHVSVLQQRPAWFRPPYLAMTEAVKRSLIAHGFTHSSAQPERWANNEMLMELPISSAGLLASDYNLITQSGMSADEVLNWLTGRFEERRGSGRPLVILLHPSIIVPFRETIKSFIRFVEQNDGVFVTADQYMAENENIRGDRKAIWMSLDHGTFDPVAAAQTLRQSQFTDAFLMAVSPEGLDYTATDGRFEDVLSALQSVGLRVHAWIPVLKNDALVATHPHWAMVRQDGSSSTAWWSPLHPEARRHFLVRVRDLSTAYRLDGVHLDYIRYPSADVDFNPSLMEAFIAEAGLNTDLTIDDILRDHHVHWTDWRANGIASLVREVRETLPPGTMLSAALLAEAATDYRASEVYAQRYTMLGPHLDAVIPMAYTNLKGKKTTWIDHVRHATRFQVGRTPIWMGIQGYQEPDRPRLSRSDLAASLARARVGSNGVSFYAYPFLFSRSGTQWDLSKGSADVVGN